MKWLSRQGVPLQGHLHAANQQQQQQKKTLTLWILCVPSFTTTPQATRLLDCSNLTPSSPIQKYFFMFYLYGYCKNAKILSFAGNGDSILTKLCLKFYFIYLLQDVYHNFDFSKPDYICQQTKSIILISCSNKII